MRLVEGQQKKKDPEMVQRVPEVSKDRKLGLFRFSPRTVSVTKAISNDNCHSPG